METSLQEYAADHRRLLEILVQEADFADPVAIDLDEFASPVLKNARKGVLLPVEGVLVGNWDPDNRQFAPGIQLGIRLYEIEGIRFARVCFNHQQEKNFWGQDFYAVSRQDYLRLYRIALRCRRTYEEPCLPPVLPQEQAEALWKNTICYLEPANLRRIKGYGGRAKRGVLLTGPPGKTSACRWLYEECRRRSWTWRIVTPDLYQAARHGCNPHEAVKQLFAVDGRGIVFFDDLDIALRDRETVRETDDQAVFLGALDGITVNEGAVFVFTTNCDLALIDRAFKRPGRIDLVLTFTAPTPVLRRQLMERWHVDIRRALDLEEAVATTEGFSFAELEELKNLLIMRFMDAGYWDWNWALEQFDRNRHDLAEQHRRVGFNLAECVGVDAEND
jgi:hypothetical protein